ncbi:MAG: type I methionyl aminopeptidase [Candidatus Brennerbacteria bacterium]|nr:type I methionyl aminopeptidase [Candidatus Brennerbacteria bacterium]
MVIKSDKELQFLIKSGKILSSILSDLKNEARLGISLKSLDSLAYKLIMAAGGQPAFLNYKPAGAKEPYPSSLCASVNNIVVHGRPDDYKLKNGDLLKLDLGVNYEGFLTDAALTIGIGEISAQNKLLIKITEEALNAGIRAAVSGNTIGDIGFAIESVVKKTNFKIVDMLTGHGIGRKLHEEPAVYNFGRSGEGLKLKKGMVLAIEPMVSAGASAIKQLADDSFAVKDGSCSAHFEKTVMVDYPKALVLT